ncbi:MAG: hypothetical protein WBE69_02040, partial [Candidatus Binataceae bacterium]
MTANATETSGDAHTAVTPAGGGGTAVTSGALSSGLPNVTGVWTGQSEAYCGPFVHEPGRCFAQQAIRFTLAQDKTGIRGFQPPAPAV